MSKVVVVGGGLAGASVAGHLAEHAHVVLLDRASQPGSEASAQNAGMVRRLGEDPWERALAVRTAAWLDEGPEWADGVSRRTGAVLGLVHDAEHLSGGVAHLRARGVQVEELASVREVAPALAGSRLLRAWYLPDERIADAHGLVQGFLGQARGHGAEVRLSTSVLGLVVESGRVRGVQTSVGLVEADAVVLAAGAWSGALAKAAGLWRPLVPLRRTLMHSAPHAVSQAGHPWCWLDDVGVYVRPETGGWLVSGCDELVDPPPERAGSAGPVDPDVRALTIDKLERYLPALADLQLRGGWTGLRTFAPDRRPVLGPDPELEGLHWAAGLGGFGVTCSVAVGECVAAWLRGETVSWITPEGVSPGRHFLGRWAIRPTGELSRSRMIRTSRGG